MSPAWIAAVVALWVLLLLVVIVVLGTLRRVIVLLERIQPSQLMRESPAGAPPMTVLSPFVVYGAHGERLTSDELLSQEATILVFVEPGCRPCQTLVQQLNDVDGSLENVPLVLVSSQSRQERFPKPSGSLRMFYDYDGEAALAFSNRATPQAYAVRRDHVVLDRRLPAFLEDLIEMAGTQGLTRGGDVARTPTQERDNVIV